MISMISTSCVSLSLSLLHVLRCVCVACRMCSSARGQPGRRTLHNNTLQRPTRQHMSRLQNGRAHTFSLPLPPPRMYPVVMNRTVTRCDSLNSNTEVITVTTHDGTHGSLLFFSRESDTCPLFSVPLTTQTEKYPKRVMFKQRGIWTL